MRVNGSLADRKGSDQVATGKSTSSSNSKKNKRRQKKSAAMPSAVQRVFEACKEVFADGAPGIVPSPDEVERLRSVLGTTIRYGRIFPSFFCLFCRMDRNRLLCSSCTSMLSKTDRISEFASAKS